MFVKIKNDLKAVFERDPAATNKLEVLLTYAGFHALMAYRIAHRFHKWGVPIIPRAISQFARWLTGIEIHPAAKIGRGFFIDHGMGVVIGETAEIGDDVTLYQGVTLGGVAPSVDSDAQRDHKRHPTLQDGVIVGSGAQVLGPIVVGRQARVGANAVVTKEVPPGATVVGIPARVVTPRLQPVEEARAAEGLPFAAYGMPGGEIPDPVARALDALRDEVQRLGVRVVELEAERAQVEEPRRVQNG